MGVVSGTHPGRPSDVCVYLQKDTDTTPVPVRGLLDSGNQFGPLISLGTALELGYRRRDFNGGPLVLESVGGSELVTVGSIPIRYSLGDDNVLETDFHALEKLGGPYDVNIPTERNIILDPPTTPVAAFLVIADREPTEEERLQMEETLRQDDAEKEKAERARERRRAADREKKKATRRR